MFPLMTRLTFISYTRRIKRSIEKVLIKGCKDIKEEEEEEEWKEEENKRRLNKDENKKVKKITKQTEVRNTK